MFTDDPQVGAWATKMLRWDQRTVIDNCGCGYSALGSGFQIGSGEEDGPAYSQPMWVFGASGGAGCYRRSVLEKIGLFDQDFLYNNEDVDLNFRLQLAGYRCRFVPNAVVYHQGSATSGATSDKTVYHILRNKEWVFFKNMPMPLLLKHFIPHLFYIIGWIVYWMMNGKTRIVWRAYLDAIREWRSVLEKRTYIQTRKYSDWHYIDSLIDKRRGPWRSQTFKNMLNLEQRRSHS
jgi:hypothetical protein